MLSKSKYVSGLQCHKRLWLQKFRPELAAPRSEAQEARFAMGNRVGALAQQLFPNGVEVPFPENRDFANMALLTHSHIQSGRKAIFEAAFIKEDVLVLCDILQRQGEQFNCYEVKSSTKVKDYHLDDAAIQYYVLKASGLSVGRMYVMTLNKKYYRAGGDLDLNQLFVSHDVTEEVLTRQAAIPRQLAEMKAALRWGEPQVPIGPHCDKPFTCEFQEYCWPQLPQPNVFSIPRIRSKKAWQFYEEGKIALSDLEPGDVRGKMAEYLRNQQEGQEKIDRPALQNWLQDLQYPLYFLDFESINPTLPLWDQTRPYQPQMAVQYSLHLVRAPGESPEHFEFLANFEEDFRSSLAERLVQDLGKAGTILAFNQSFEKGCIEKLIAWCPKQASALSACLVRFKDLMTPFEKGWYYLPAMGGSYSIKSVYPALFPDECLSYQGLRISNGEQAMQQLQRLAEEGVDPNTMPDEALRADLLAYCKLDTWAMVKIFNCLYLKTV